MRMVSDHVVSLPDGRHLGYRQYGSPDGQPIFYFHGWPCSRLEAALLEPEAERAGARILAVDRPGHGLSDFQPNRTLLDWPHDVSSLAERLDLERFSLVGVSGGGPYAAVSAWALGGRVCKTCLVGSLAPLDHTGLPAGMHWGNRTLLKLAGRLPQLGRWLLAPFGWSLKLGLPPVLSRPFAGGFADVDRRVLRQPELGRTIYEATREAFRQGARGPAWEGRIYSRPWGFTPAEIRTPVDIWHGGADRNVPPSMAHRLHRSIPGSRLLLYPEEGHLSLPYSHRRSILDHLLREVGTGTR